MSEQATPRPWGRDGWHVYTGAGMSKRDIVQPESEADAALIVRAVNAHDDLVAALRALVALVDQRPMDAVLTQDGEQAVMQARALLRGLSPKEEGQ